MKEKKVEASKKINTIVTPKDYGIYLQKNPGKRAKHKINRKRAGRL